MIPTSNSLSDPLLSNGLPANLEVERAVLGAILLDNRICNQASQLLRREDFFLDSHRHIFDKMIDLNTGGSPIDLITLGEELRCAGKFEQVGGATYISYLVDGVLRVDTLEPYIKILKEKLTVSLVFLFSNFIKLFVVITNIFNFTIGAILIKNQEKYKQFVVYRFKKL